MDKRDQRVAPAAEIRVDAEHEADQDAVIGVRPEVLGRRQYDSLVPGEYRSDQRRKKLDENTDCDPKDQGKADQSPK